MRTVISTLFVSADGVAEVDPAWHFPSFDAVSYTHLTLPTNREG